MTRVLITGRSGTGKSTALAELARRSHRVVDADLSGWSIEVTSQAGSGAEQLWREEAMDALLASTSPDGSSSQGAPLIKARFTTASTPSCC